MRADILRMIAEAGSGHPGGSLIMRRHTRGAVLRRRHGARPAHPQWEGRDRFILAKGHAAPALYAVLAQAGYFPREELATLRKLGSRLQGHPDSNQVPGVEVSTGSLGQGLSVAAGAAAGLKLDGAPQTVFALLGDGECQEGQVWEAAMFAAHRQLDNLVAVVDRNDLQIDGRTCDVCDPGDLGAKFAAFGWDVAEVDGHDLDALVAVLGAAKAGRDGTRGHRRRMRIARNRSRARARHGKRGGLAREGPECGQAAEAVIAALEGGVGKESIRGYAEQTRRAQAQQKKATRAAPSHDARRARVRGRARRGGGCRPHGSTTTKKLADAGFADRLFNCGIAEQNMVDVAAGLAITGHVAFTGSFAVFGTGRAYDQIRNTVCYSNLT